MNFITIFCIATDPRFWIDSSPPEQKGHSIHWRIYAELGKGAFILYQIIDMTSMLCVLMEEFMKYTKAGIKSVAKYSFT